MKAKTLLFLISLMATILHGQKISIGPEIGFVSSVNTINELSDLENRRNTYYLGLNFNYKYNRLIQFSTGLHYLKQGYKFETCYLFEEGVKNELVGKLDYLIVPLSVNFNFGKSDRLLAGIGVYGGLNIKAAQDYPERIGGCSKYYPEDITDVTQKYMFGASLNIGYKIYKDEGIELKTLLKYYQGVSNTMRNPYSDLVWKDRSNSLLLTFVLDYDL